MPQHGHHPRPSGLARTSFTACRETADPALEHALADKATLCGIQRPQVTVYRHLFATRQSGTCSDCRVKAVAASSRT
ncbi:hypothetical protein [Streptomyces niveus]|uniref:hypothetical protein n=1 Tax=Streptomyces niveus TaxID=193462 RepID=UPI00341930FB